MKIDAPNGLDMKKKIFNFIKTNLVGHLTQNKKNLSKKPKTDNFCFLQNFCQEGFGALLVKIVPKSAQLLKDAEKFSLFLGFKDCRLQKIPL